MKTTLLRISLLALMLTSRPTGAAEGVAVIAHPNVTKIDAVTLERVFTGRAVLVGGVPVTAVNIAPGNPVRARFLQAFVKRDEDSYAGYWLVSRYSGLGTPPRELRSNAEVIKFVQSTPGAIGYIDESEVRPGMNVLIK